MVNLGWVYEDALGEGADGSVVSISSSSSSLINKENMLLFFVIPLFLLFNQEEENNAGVTLVPSMRFHAEKKCS